MSLPSGMLACECRLECAIVNGGDRTTLANWFSPFSMCSEDLTPVIRLALQTSTLPRGPHLVPACFHEPFSWFLKSFILGVIYFN